MIRRKTISCMEETVTGGDERKKKSAETAEFRNLQQSAPDPQRSKPPSNCLLTSIFFETFKGQS